MKTYCIIAAKKSQISLLAYKTNEGITIMGLYDFLIDSNSLNV